MSSRAALSSLRIHLRNTLVRPLYQVMILVQPVMMATLAHYVYRDASDSFYVVLGSGMSGMWMATAFSSAGDIGRERGNGTIQPVMVAEVPIWVVFAGRTFGALLLSAIPVCVSMLFSVLILGRRFPDGASAPGLLLAVVVFGLGCHALGLLLSNLFLLSRRTVVLQNFLEWPLLITSGVIIPVSALPEALRRLASALPMRWGAEAAARAYGGGGIAWGPIGLALLLTAAYVTASVLLWRLIERRVRVTASLDLA
ncbi:hypothetical protein GCM10009850_119870 [Nonomuraea monospora]|uniref:ABC-2 type transporter transmembrane domain-containing protein n=1 Tax=Nonomuraea monospora TaxID=568818 RepID=A0ABN3D477_9ACTN